MGAWHNYVSSVNRTLTDNIEDNPLIPDFIGHNIMSGEAHAPFVVNGKEYYIEQELNGEIDVVGPSLKTNDGLYILTYDNKFINVIRRDDNG